ncbi:cellulose synthase-like protein D3-like, partial [Trifolium medium]|nr:cellulose synthase-like protein D3-like [Trifolium medium]
SGSGSDWMGGDPNVFKDKPWKPLTRTVNIPAAILSPYRSICPVAAGIDRVAIYALPTLCS